MKNFFTEVRQKYPRGYGMFHKFFMKDYTWPIPMEAYNFESISGWLTAFFDEQGIIIRVSYYNNPVTKTNFWGYKIKDLPVGIWLSPITEKTRSEAFTSAALKAFEVLEGRG